MKGELQLLSLSVQILTQSTTAPRSLSLPVEVSISNAEERQYCHASLTHIHTQEQRNVLVTINYKQAAHLYHAQTLYRSND